MASQSLLAESYCLGMDNRAEVREFLISRRAKLTPQQAGLPDVGQPSRARLAPRRGRRPRRGEHRVLLQTGTRRPRRRLRHRPRRDRPRPPTRRRRTGPPVPPRPRRRRHQRGNAAPPPHRETLDTPAQPAMGPGHHHRAGHRPKRADGPAGDQPPRPSHALLAVRHATRAASRTSPATPSSTTTHTASTPTGTPPPTPAWPSCAPKPAATPMTRVCTTSSGSCPPAARTSAAAGARHNVRYHGAGTKHFHHHVVGNLELAYESVDMISEPGLTMTIYAAEPGSRPNMPCPPRILDSHPRRRHSARES